MNEAGEEDSDGPEDDTPSAPPHIEADYVLALGRFLLAFNRLDSLLGEVVETVLRRLGREDLIKPCVEDAEFGLRLRYLDLLTLSTEGVTISNVPIPCMRRIAGERNILAHGHFDQNPYDGTYRIVGRKKEAYYSSSRIDELAIQATDACRALSLASAIYDFSDDDGR